MHRAFLHPQWALDGALPQKCLEAVANLTITMPGIALAQELIMLLSMKI